MAAPERRLSGRRIAPRGFRIATRRALALKTAMARKARPEIPRSFRRTKMFLAANLVLWGAIGGWFLFQPPERKAEVSRLVANLVEGKKGITAFDVAWDLWQIYGSKDFVPAAVALPANRSAAQTHVYGGVLPQSTRKVLRILENEGYLAGYSEALGNPVWAAYRVRDVETLNAPPRPDEFNADPRTAVRVDPQVYSGSGYDRGHLAPNYAIATRYGRRAQRETFLMSNIVPQRHALNAGAWARLEQRIATNYAGRFGEVWVIAGPIFGEQPARLKRLVAVPEAFFMIVVDESEGRVRALAFAMNQETPEQLALAEALTTIDEIERRTGLDFLSVLPDDAEALLEGRKAARVW
jgi:endonuclease G, mitochondrial